MIARGARRRWIRRRVRERSRLVPSHTRIIKIRAIRFQPLN
jgi:hypothetical protein